MCARCWVPVWQVSEIGIAPRERNCRAQITAKRRNETSVYVPGLFTRRYARRGQWQRDDVSESAHARHTRDAHINGERASVHLLIPAAVKDESSGRRTSVPNAWAVLLHEPPCNRAHLANARGVCIVYGIPFGPLTLHLGKRLPLSSTVSTEINVQATSSSNLTPTEPRATNSRFTNSSIARNV